MNRRNAIAGLDIIKSYVAGQAALGYAEFNPPPSPTDVILATYPKSGSTWTSYLLYQIKSGCSDNFNDIKDVVVDITPGHWDPSVQPFISQQEFLPRTYKTHGTYKLCPKGAKYIYVSRDPKDIFWSLYQFIHDLLGIEERVPVDAFYSEYFVKRFDTGHDIGNVWDHILDWFPLRGKENMLWMHYEDIVAHRKRALDQLAGFMGVDLNDEQREKLIKHSSMQHMRTIASKIDPSPDNYVGKLVLGFGKLTQRYASQMKVGKLRKGVPGDGLSSVPIELQQEMDREWLSRITPIIGFKSYTDMMNSCSPMT
jgi:hypothetical protein